MSDIENPASLPFPPLSGVTANVAPVLRAPHPSGLNGEYAAAVALSVGAVDGHTGILFVRKDGTEALLHLATHLRLKLENVSSENFKPTSWIVPTVPAERLQILAKLCEDIVAQPRYYLIPYGFDFKKSTFFLTGEFSLGDGEAGLTCSTFMLAIYQRAGVKLLDMASWSQASEGRQQEDNAAQQKLIALFREQANKIDEDLKANKKGKKDKRDTSKIAQILALQDYSHQLKLQAQKLESSEIGYSRYRAEEVAAASGMDCRPVTFQRAEEAGKVLMAEVRALADLVRTSGPANNT